MDKTNLRSYARGESPLEVPFTTIPDMLQTNSIKTPDALIHKYVDWKTFESEDMTYKELYTEATKFAKGLRAMGLDRGDIVALGNNNSKDWTISLVGIQMAGVVPLLFTFNEKDGRDIKELLTKLGDRCKAIIFPPGDNNTYLSILDQIIKKGCEKGSVTCPSSKSLQWGILMSREANPYFLNTADIKAKGQGYDILPEVDPEDTAGIFMTSGSTGEPKLIPHSHYSLLVCGFYFSLGFGVTRKVYFNDRPFSWIGGFPCWEFFTGGTRVLIKHGQAIPSLSRYKEIVLRILQTQKCECSLLITPILHEILADKEGRWHFDSVGSGGQPVPRALTAAATRVCDRFIVFYGSSELGMISRQVFERDREYVDYEVGKPFPGVEVKIVDHESGLVRRGERGEVLIRSPLRFTEYFQDEEKTLKVLTKYGWFRTDDSAIMKHDGSLVVEGRVSDSLVKSAGPGYTSVAFIEGRLKQNPAVRDAVVISFRDEEHFVCVCCAVILKEGAKCSEEELDEYLLDPEHHTVDLYQQITVPRRFIFLDSFPKSYNGKTNRKEIALICKTKFVR